MFLIQLLLPVTQNASPAEPVLRRVRKELTERFGGVTAYTRAPAHGVWLDDTDTEVHDDVTIVEVMAEQIDHAWWSAFRKQLEEELDQDVVVVRSSTIELL
jgi:hypothetical protein